MHGYASLFVLEICLFCSIRVVLNTIPFLLDLSGRMVLWGWDLGDLGSIAYCIINSVCDCLSLCVSAVPSTMGPGSQLGALGTTVLQIKMDSLI